MTQSNNSTVSSEIFRSADYLAIFHAGTPDKTNRLLRTVDLDRRVELLLARSFEMQEALVNYRVGEPAAHPQPILRPKIRRHQPRPRPPDGLRTLAEAAARLGCSVKTLNGHVAASALKYVSIGHGTKRPRKMFTDADLNAFIEAQTRKDAPCPSSAIRARHTGASTSKSKVIAFSAVPRPRPGGKRKP